VCVAIHTQGQPMKETMNKTIEDVADENSCRYPLGELNDPPKYFCGQPIIRNDSGWLYCRKHIIICTNPKEKT